MKYEEPFSRSNSFSGFTYIFFVNAIYQLVHELNRSLPFTFLFNIELDFEAPSYEKPWNFFSYDRCVLCMVH